MLGLTPFNRKNGNMISNSIEDFYNILDDFFSDNRLIKGNFGRDTFKVDIQEGKKEYLVEAELPGVKREEISMRLNENKLNISIAREENISEEKKNYIHKERRYSSMSRSIYLPDAQAEGIKAKLDKGVLSVIVPKQEKLDSSVTIEIE